jgi:hypothetical protein
MSRQHCVHRHQAMTVVVVVRTQSAVVSTSSTPSTVSSGTL